MNDSELRSKLISILRSECSFCKNVLDTFGDGTGYVRSKDYYEGRYYASFSILYSLENMEV